MKDDSKNKRGRGTQDVDLGLNGLFGALGDAIGEMVSRLEEGHSGAVTRDHVFETDKGPVRASAGVKLQIGGLEIGRAHSGPLPEPVNPSRENPKPSPKRVRSLEYDIFEESDSWFLTADIPGVSRGDLELSQDGTCLKIETTGARLFSTSADLNKPFHFDRIETRLSNGVLTLTIPKMDEVV